MKYDLSVIIPYFNNQETIERCIKSLKTNKLNMQIIVINDGSEPLVNIQDKDIQIINNTTNKGVSFSRNLGLAKIKANYFTFVDADDYLKDKAYDYIFSQNLDINADLICFNYLEVSEKYLNSPYKYNHSVISKSTFTDMVLKDEISLKVWDKIYSTKKYGKYRFDEDLKINEDYLYILNLLDKCEKVLLLNDCLYYYNYNRYSLTKNYTCSKIERNNYLKKINKAILENHKNYKFFISNHELKQINQYSLCIDKHNRYSYLKKNINRQSLRELLKYKITIFKRLEVLIFLFSIRIHLLCFPIYKYIRKIVRR